MLLDAAPDIANFQFKQDFLDAHLTSGHNCSTVALQGGGRYGNGCNITD